MGHGHTFGVAPLSLVLLVLSVPAAGEPGRPDRPRAAELGVRPHGTYVQVSSPISAPRPGQPMYAEGGPAVLFLNRAGGRFESAWVDDSATNQSSLLTRSVELPAFPYDDASWQAVLDCMRDKYAPFDIEVTDVEPGNVAHIEVVIAGHPRDLGMVDGVGGVAPMACTPLFNAVTYAFPETYGDDPTGICEAAAQESAHAFGLDHELLCNDLMTYLSCGMKRFVNGDAPCGEFEERACACGDDTQNSHEYLMTVLGPAGAPPVVEITSPAEGDEVDAGFTVEAAADGDRGIERLELWIDGEIVVTLDSEPWTFEAPEDLADGPHGVRVVAYDDVGASSADEVSVEVTADSGHRRRRGCAQGPSAPTPLSSSWVLVLAAGLVLIRRGRKL